MLPAENKADKLMKTAKHNRTQRIVTKLSKMKS